MALADFPKTLSAIAGVIVAGGTVIGFLTYFEARPVILKEFLPVVSSLDIVKVAAAEIEKRTADIDARFKLAQLRIDALDKSVALQQFYWLKQKQETGGLTFEEQQIYCALAEQLHFTRVDGCPRAG